VGGEKRGPEGKRRGGKRVKGEMGGEVKKGRK